jgi:hypothetical protein
VELNATYLPSALTDGAKLAPTDGCSPRRVHADATESPRRDVEAIHVVARSVGVRAGDQVGRRRRKHDRTAVGADSRVSGTSIDRHFWRLDCASQSGPSILDHRGTHAVSAAVERLVDQKPAVSTQRRRSEPAVGEPAV